MKLVITEKPSVARAIASVLGANTKKDGYTEGNGYKVSWCFGHLVSLYIPNDYGEQWSGMWNFEQLPIIPEHWKFKVTNSCKGQFGILKKLLNDIKVDEVICATDAAREGECIFRYVYNLSGSRKPVKRLWISSLEESSIKDGFANLKDSSKYDNLYNAGFCRAKADWLVGMNGSRLFSVRYKNKLNIGRVQTPTLAMIVKRDFEVKNFVKQKYFTVELDCGEFIASSERIDDETIAESLISTCNGKTASVIEVKKEVKTINPPKLFDLTSLQREANKIYGYTAQQTLDYIQSLYEGKLATYPRTDSQYLSEDMEQTAIDVIMCICKMFTNVQLNDSPNVKRCINNRKVTDHHAIIPTVNIENIDLNSLSNGEKNILLLLAFRFLCAVSKPHKYESIKTIIVCERKDFIASGRTVIENGWHDTQEKALQFMNAKNSDDKSDSGLLDIVPGQKFDNVTAAKAAHWTNPPQHYTEDTLLSAMEHAGQENYDDNTEKKGLGTPATRAATIEGLIKNGYMERKGKKIIATEKGINLIQVVPDEVKSPKLTSDWEMQLQQIERGEYSADIFMQEITGFVKDICKKYGSTDDRGIFKVNKVKPIGKCPKCGSDVKKGKFGFYCTGKCGMDVAKVYGKVLTEIQLLKLLNGRKTSFERKGRKTTVFPEVVPFKYTTKEGKHVSGFQWKIKKS